MRRALLHNHVVNSRSSKVVQEWSIFERGCLQSCSSREIHSGDRSEKEDESETGGRRGSREANAETNRPMKTVGRGRGAFSHFLRLHERNIDKHSAAGSRSRGGRRARDQGVSGQFDDAVEEGDAKGRLGSRGTDRDQQKGGTVRGKLSEGNKSIETWVQEWFAQVEEEGEPGEPDWDDLNDVEGEDEDEDGQKKGKEEFGPNTWWAKDKEDFEEYKKLIARMEKEEREQLDALQEKWESMKLKAAEEGNTEKLELPHIVLTTEMTYEAPEGTATVDRPKPPPRSLETILQSMEIPADLDVKLDDPEYEEMLNMWQTVARNNTMDERMKEEIMKRIARFVAKHRDSGALDKALGLTEIKRTSRRGKRKAR